MFTGLILSIAGKLGFSKLTEKAAGMIGTVIAIGLAVAVFFILLDAYGDARFREGESHADAKWQEASRALEEQAASAEDEEDALSAERVAEHNERVREERERLDEAETHGTSPLDVLFGPGG